MPGDSRPLMASRDQKAKLYVQHKLLERAAEIYAWLEEGAHIYVCGDASRMARERSPRADSRFTAVPTPR